MSPLKATWIGVSTILFDDGSTSILIDGFFTRPSMLTTLVFNIGPNKTIIKECIDRLGVKDRLAAVLVAHSHFDHMLDAPQICLLTGAKLVGSESTRHFGLGEGMGDEDVRVVEDGDEVVFGDWKLKIFEGLHSPGDIAPGCITSALSSPCSFKDMKSDKCYSYLISHSSTKAKTFIHPSANFVKDKFRDVRCDTLFLGIGALGGQSSEFKEEYWEETVGCLKPSVIVPIHWDDFFKSVSKPVAPMWERLDQVSVSRAWLEDKCRKGGDRLCFPEFWQEFDVGSDGAAVRSSL